MASTAAQCKAQCEAQGGPGCCWYRPLSSPVRGSAFTSHCQWLAGTESFDVGDNLVNVRSATTCKAAADPPSLRPSCYATCDDVPCGTCGHFCPVGPACTLRDGTVASRNGCDCNARNTFCGSGDTAVRVCNDKEQAPASAYGVLGIVGLP